MIAVPSFAPRPGLSSVLFPQFAAKNPRLQMKMAPDNRNNPRFPFAKDRAGKYIMPADEAEQEKTTD